MDYTEDIAPLEGVGLSDSAIAAILSCVTVRPVMFVDFNNFTYDRDLARKHPITLNWEGPLPEIANADGHPLQQGIAKLYSHLNKPQSTQIDTSIEDVKDLIASGRVVEGEFERNPWCIMAAELMEGLIQAEVITASHRTGFYALGGGLKYGTVTADQVGQARGKHQARAFAATLAERVYAAIKLAGSAGGATEQSIRDAAVEEAGK